MKGITPIISIIVLLLITVSLAGAAYVFLSNYMTGYMGQAIQASGICVGGNESYITITNMGTLPVNLGGCATSGTAAFTSAQSADCGDITVIKTDGGVTTMTGYFNLTSGGQNIAAAEPGVLHKASFRDTACTTTGNPARCTYAFTRAGELQPVTVTVNCGG